ncbi:protein-L-isoaspartate O-methyltransferase [Actinocatenispora thailandica]|uniref:Protein-L-isoaspartate O-methyltransferase n=1 Tax=Actinocatenispora thailandica TaxID=227318 RepID=A0A7R7DL98_9ACTN|nr:ATP-grasp peptide maturase system methyltransferase [Actinocatenispora thailandica]BCJ33571.1 protein-L-isoaspartate O-methyltransferase [Actinocatenispora thailandica]
MATISQDDTGRYRRRMVGELRRGGWLRSPAWIDAFQAVPRHAFVPRFFIPTDTGHWAAVCAQDRGWAERAYTLGSLVTQLGGDESYWGRARDAPLRGTPTSSSSDPRLMATMLEALDVRDGHTVLEIGTGAGYNAGLISHRIGSRNVTSVEVDAGLARTARQRLAECGYHPTIVTSDGTNGVPEASPYDRIIATVAAPTVPAAWVEQTRIGGLILLNPYTELGSGPLVLLTVTDRGRAEGRFLPSYGAFMPFRAHQPARSDQERLSDALRSADGRRTATEVPVDVLHQIDAGMLIGLLVPHVAWIGFTPEGGRSQLWLLGDDGSWAVRDDDGVEQRGERRIWDEIAAAYGLWQQLGSPGRERFGLTVTVDGKQTIWLDGPDRTVAPLALDSRFGTCGGG